MLTHMHVCVCFRAGVHVRWCVFGCVSHVWAAAPCKAAACSCKHLTNMCSQCQRHSVCVFTAVSGHVCVYVCMFVQLRHVLLPWRKHAVAHGKQPHALTGPVQGFTSWESGAEGVQGKRETPDGSSNPPAHAVFYYCLWGEKAFWAQSEARENLKLNSYNPIGHLIHFTMEKQTSQTWYLLELDICHRQINRGVKFILIMTSCSCKQEKKCLFLIVHSKEDSTSQR